MWKCVRFLTTLRSSIKRDPLLKNSTNFHQHYGPGDKFPNLTTFQTYNKMNIRMFCSKSKDINPETVRIVTLDGDDKSKAKPDLSNAQLKVIFELHDGRELIGKANHGDTLLDVVINNELEIDGFGACEGTLACSTCHLIFSEDDFNRLPNEINDEEMDMLDMAYGLTETSRLGCQIFMSKEFDGLRVKVPPVVNDVRLR